MLQLIRVRARYHNLFIPKYLSAERGGQLREFGVRWAKIWHFLTVVFLNSTTKLVMQGVLQLLPKPILQRKIRWMYCQLKNLWFFKFFLNLFLLIFIDYYLFCSLCYYDNHSIGASFTVCYMMCLYYRVLCLVQR